MDRDELEHRFKYHAPDEKKQMTHAIIRNNILDLTLFIEPQLPDGREKSLFVTKMEEAMFWANAALARS